MSPFKTPHEKKSAVLTACIGLLLLVSFLFIGLSYYDPPITYGVAVNFGTTTTGRGITPPKASKQALSQPKTTAVKKPSTPKPKATPTAVKKTVTQERSTVQLPEENTKKAAAATTPKQEPQAEPTPPSPPQPKVDESTKNILKNLVEAQQENPTPEQSEGDDASEGDKGKSTGDPYASSYYSTAGAGGTGTQYGLNGRSLQVSGKVVQDCNEEGIVVVRITVDQNGRVIAAQPGVKGTTNSHPCLLAPAKATALKHQWNMDFNAPNKQIGFIVIKFKLGE